MSTIRKTFQVDGVLTDMTSVLLSDPTGSYGVRREDTGAVVVPDGTAMDHVSTGVYEHTFRDPADDLTYLYYLEVTHGRATFWVIKNHVGPKRKAAGR